MSIPTRAVATHEVPTHVRSAIELAAQAQREHAGQVEHDPHAPPPVEVVDPRVDQANRLTEAQRAAVEHQPFAQLDPALQQAVIIDFADAVALRVADNLAARGGGWVWKLTKWTGTAIASWVAHDLTVAYGPIVKERATEYGTEASQWVVQQGARAVEYFFNKGELVNSDVIYKESQRSPVMLKLKDSTITKETFRFLEEPETVEAFVSEHDVDGPRFWTDHRPRTTPQPGEITLSKTFLERQEKALGATLPTQIDTWVKIKGYGLADTTLSDEKFLAQRDALISEYTKNGPDAMYDAAGKMDNETHRPAQETLTAALAALLRIVG